MVSVLNFVLKITISATKLTITTKIRQVMLPIPVRVKRAVPRLTSNVNAPNFSVFFTTNKIILPMIKAVIPVANTCIIGIIMAVSIPTPYITAA